MLSNLPIPVIIAHRGASAYAPENTLAAFKLALEQGADGIELDVRLTADNQVVVFHDMTLDRITPCKGRVDSFKLNDLRKIDVGSHFDVTFRGETIPSLEEVFRAIGQFAFINVELKDYDSFSDPLPIQVAKLVKRYGLYRRVIISSFSPIPLIRIRRLLPNTPIGLLVLGGKAGLITKNWLGRLLKYQILYVKLNDVSPNLLRNIHQKGNKVFAYTINQEEEMRYLFKMGVDGVITNNPILARQTLSSIQFVR